MRGLLLVISGFGLLAGAKLSIEHIQHGEVCPMLGPVPACIIVFLGYLAVFLAALCAQKSWSRKLFYAGWAPVFLLAAIGVVLELLQGDVCPPGPANIPQCFFSFAMILSCWLLFRSYTKAPRK